MERRPSGHTPRSSQSHAVAALAAGLCIACAGCTVVRPEARATAVESGRSANGSTEVMLYLELRNPGSDEIELVQYDYTLALGDGSSYGGRWAALRALPPGQTVTAEVPALLPTASLRGASTQWRASGSIAYRDPRSFARILYEAGILKPESSFSGSGSGITERGDTADAASETARPDAAR